MNSMWRRWYTTSSSSDDLLEGRRTDDEEQQHGDCDENDSLPRSVHLGLSIDSESYDNSDTSSLSDLDEGMPLWAKSPSRSKCQSFDTEELKYEQDQTPAEVPKNPLQLESLPTNLQISMPPQASRLVQRSNSLKRPSNTILPTHGQIWKDDEDLDCKLDDFNTTQRIVSQQRLLRFFFAVLAIGFMAVVSKDQPLNVQAWWDRQEGGATPRPNFPSFSARAPPQLPNVGFGNTMSQRSLAFARPQASLPVFPSPPEDDELASEFSNSSPFVSFLGGCAFVAILLETGWKSYQKSKLQKRKWARSVRRLYKS